MVLWKSGIEMAQPNVAREPSMEEILASIRRIIESNEPGQGVDFPADVSFADEPSLGAASHVPPAHVPPAANQAFGQRLSSEREANDRLNLQGHALNGEAPAEKSMSLADVAARAKFYSSANSCSTPSIL
jgi:cell pole-organizing protein PopZ